MRRHALFIGVFILIAAAWSALLALSQTHVHSDEAIIGLMGKHILEGRYFPFYMYGQPYNAGAAWEAYVAAIAFRLFGVGVIPLKGCIVALSLLCLFLFYRMGCARSIPAQVAFSSERLLLVFPIDPSTDDAFCVHRISSGSETKAVIFLWASVGREHLVLGNGDPARCRFMDTADFARQALAQ